MHRIPKNTDLSPLVGKNVEQVCIGAHEVVLNLSDDLYITIEGGFAFGDEERLEEPDFRGSANKFTKLLNDVMVLAKVLRDDKVLFIFSSGTTLTIYDDSDHGESFVIKLPDRLVVA